MGTGIAPEEPRLGSQATDHDHPAASERIVTAQLGDRRIPPSLERETPKIALTAKRPTALAQCDTVHHPTRRVR